MINVPFKADFNCWLQPMGHSAYYCRKTIAGVWQVKLDGLWQKLPDDLPFSVADLERVRTKNAQDLMNDGYAVFSHVDLTDSDLADIALSGFECMVLETGCKYLYGAQP